MQTIRTPQKEATILAALREHPSYQRACRKARIVKSSLWAWRRDDPAFAARVEAAREEGLDAVEDALMERATTNDTTAGIFLLKTWRPERYRERVEHSVDVRQAAERAAARLNLPVDVVLSEVTRWAEDAQP